MTKTNADWSTIRAEYIGGGISQRKLAAKYGISADSLMQKANREHWKRDRDITISKTIATVQQKTADAACENAAIAERIRMKLLKRIEKEIDALPEYIGTELVKNVDDMVYAKNRLVKRTSGGKNYKLRDLTAAYRDLTADMQKEELQNNEPVQIVWGKS